MGRKIWDLNKGKNHGDDDVYDNFFAFLHFSNFFFHLRTNFQVFGYFQISVDF